MVEIAASRWTPRSPWAGVLAEEQIGVRDAAGVTVQPLHGFGLATVIAKGGNLTALAAAVRAATGLDLPAKPEVRLGGDHKIVWSGPGQWLVWSAGRAGLAAVLNALAPHAAVSDQSAGRAALRIAGPRVRDVLAKGALIDLHPSAFPVHATAMTSFAHMGVQLWRAEDGPEGASFDILVSRSMAGSFWSWLSASAAEFGCRVIPGRG